MIIYFRIAEVAVVVENCYRYGRDCKSEVLRREYAPDLRARVWLDGNGIIGRSRMSRCLISARPSFGKTDSI